MSSTTNGNAQLSFAGQSVTLQGISASELSVFGPENIIFKSDIYPMGWQGKYVVDGFDSTVDKIQGTSGIGFKHLKAYETDSALVIGPQAQDGGIYSSYTLTGLTLADLNADMFIDVAGSFDRLGFIVPLNWQTWTWNSVLSVKSFDVANTTLTSTDNIPFSSVKLSQVGADVELTLLEPFANGDKKKVVLQNVEVNDLNASNFSGFSGDFSEVTIYIPVLYSISVNVNTTGGSVSPAPDSLGILMATGGQDFTINFIPDDGYRVASIILDGVSYPVSNNITISNVSSDMSLSVTFEEGISCPDVWALGTVYQGGDRVTYEGSIYEAKWYSDANQPDLGDPWTLVGECK